MKKMVGLLVVLALCFSFISVNAAMPEELSKALTGTNFNYSTTGKVEFKDADFKSLVDFLYEIGGEDIKNAENFIDFELLLESIFTSGAEVNIKSDISEDMKKMNAYMELLFDLKLNPNKNAEIHTKARLAMWVKIDLAAEEPVYQMIIEAPVLNKYAVIDLFAMVSEADKVALDEILAEYEKTYSAEYVNNISKVSLDITEKYADVKKSGSKYTLTITNEDMPGMFKDLIGFILDIMLETSPETFHEDPEVAKATVELVKQMLPAFSGIKLLGEKGSVIEYTLSKGKIAKATETDYFEIDIPSIVTSFGGTWEYESKPVISFTLKAESEYTNYGKTVVDFPVLTEENSFDLVKSIMGDMENGYYEEDNYTEEYIPEYPLWYFSFETEKVIIEGEKIYVPLRTVLESAYEGNIELAYDNGVITVTSEYFKDYDKMVFSVGSGEIVIGDKTINTDAVIMEDGVTYISCDALSELFNWEIEYADYDLINKVYYISFWEWEDYQEDEFAA